MFTQVPAAAATTSGLHSSHQVSQQHSSSGSSSPRPSRLRGLSYLRNYTQNHLLSREHSAAGQQHSQTTPSSPTRTPLGRTSSHTDSPSVRPTSTLHRTTSASATTTLSPHAALANANRLTLVNPESHPLSLAPPPRPSPSRRSTESALPSVLVDLSNPAPEPQTPTPTSTAAAAPSAQSGDNMVRTRSATMTEAAPQNGGGAMPDVLPSIRFSTFYDPRAARPSLTFSPISRTLPTGEEVIKVGRYSERDSQPNIPPNVPSAAPVGFKSKVVSRRHCEFWYEGGKWYIKDVKSSSGTFLNHIRLSPPGTESKPFPVNDGDIVQLGIDFKGGEEMIFRCVKMRLELNRGWQNKLNTFNMTTHKRLRNMTASSGGNAPAGQSYTQDCSICLNSIAPCQSLFVAPCSHTWHFKCIRSLLSSPQYPIFICPNCRAAADLEADVEDPEEWEQDGSEEEEPSEQEGANLKSQASEAELSEPSQPLGPPRSKPREPSGSARTPAAQPVPAPAPAQQHDPDAMDLTMMDESETPANNNPRPYTAVPSSNAMRPPIISTNNNHQGGSANATSSPVPIPSARTASGQHGSRNNRNGATRTPSPTTTTGGTPALLNGGHEGPITPRNEAGPWVFDGSGVRMRIGGDVPTVSLDAAASGGNGGGEMILDEITVAED